MFKYVLSYTAEPSIMGVKDGICQIRLSDKNDKDPNLKRFLFNDNKPWPNLKVDNLLAYDSVLEFDLRKHAKLTDYIIHGPYIHIVGVFSERFINFLQKFRLHENVVIKEVFLYSDNEKIQDRYFLIQQPNLNKEIVWENTLFYNSLERDLASNKVCYKFKDESHYADAVCVDVSRISFDKIEVNQYDFVSALSEHFVSDRLAKAMAEENFSNIILKNIDLIECSETILHD